MTHAPGPWKIEGHFDAETGVSVVAADDVLVCDIEPYTEEWTEQEIANVRLIAAAPELLDALKSAESHLLEQLSCDRCHPVHKCPTLDCIREVIAKAEGRA